MIATLRASYEISVDGGRLRFRCYDGHSVLHAMRAVGLRGIPVGCRGGGCGVCRVQVLKGAYRTGCMSARHVGTFERQQHIALACQLLPSSDVELRVIGSEAAGSDHDFEAFKSICRQTGDSGRLAE